MERPRAGPDRPRLPTASHPVLPHHHQRPFPQLAESEVEKKGDAYVLKSDPSVKVSARAHKMSKSRGNVVNPDDVVDQFGADSLRLYEMFMGPLRDTKVGGGGEGGWGKRGRGGEGEGWGMCRGEERRWLGPGRMAFAAGAGRADHSTRFAAPSRRPKVWSTRGVEGVHRFLARAWRALEGGVTDDAPTKDQLRLLHATIKKVPAAMGQPGGGAAVPQPAE